jgi:hypothetical protein
LGSRRSCHGQVQLKHSDAFRGSFHNVVPCPPVNMHIDETRNEEAISKIDHGSR